MSITRHSSICSIIQEINMEHLSCASLCVGDKKQRHNLCPQEAYSIIGQGNTIDMDKLCWMLYCRGMNNVLWERREWKMLPGGCGSMFTLLVCILFHHWKPRGQFLHILIWQDNIYKIFYCPQIIRETIHMA